VPALSVAQGSPRCIPPPPPGPSRPVYGPVRILPNCPRTRLQDNIRKPKSYTDGTVRYGLLAQVKEPSSLNEALDDENWRSAWMLSTLLCCVITLGILFLLPRVKI
jgi:hypothetical protein